MTPVKKTGCPSLISLPTEVLCQILLHLDNPSILAARQTSRALYFASKSTHLWRQIINRLQMCQGVPAPEEEMDAYTAEELEKWAFQRHRAQAVWAGISKHRFRTRAVGLLPDTSSHPPRYSKLIPGGRWLLVGYSNATMYTIDLEDASLTSRLLYDPSEFGKELRGREIGVTNTFWVDSSKSRLSLRIAGCITEGFTDVHTFVYQVDLVGHGSAATLIAKPYAFFPNHGPGDRNPGFGLNERYVVDHWEGEYHHYGPADTGELRVYDYSAKLFKEGEDHQPMSSDSNPIICELSSSLCNAIDFVHEDIFVVLGTSPDSVYVFEINPITSSITLLHIIEASPYDLWSGIVGCSGSSESRMVLLGSDPFFICGIVIPHHKNIPVTIVDFAEGQSDWNPHSTITALGTSVSLLYQSGWSRDVGVFRILNQSWDKLQPSQVVDYLSVEDESIIINRNFKLASFDQSNGRLVYTVYGSGWIVVDLA